MSRVRPLSSELRPCPECGTIQSSAHNFCAQCGVLLQEWLAPSPIIGLPDAALPTYLSERIRNTLRAPEAERKQVTILFADVVGSTALIRRLDPERVAAALDPALEAMTRAVHSHDGLVSRIQGDGIMALFGAPVADEHHALQACRAALQMRDDVRSDVKLRVGLHSGEIILRAARSNAIVDYDAVGVSVHIAARVEKNARPGSIYISAATAHIVGGAFRLHPVGPIRSKGTGRLEAFELLAELDGANNWRLRSLRGLNKFVGRDDELGRLRAGAAKAQAGQGQVFALTGPPGSGKSRLVHEVAAELRKTGWRVGEASAGPEDELSGYRPIAAMVRGWLGAAADDSPSTTFGHLENFCRDIGETASVAPLAALLDLPIADQAWRAKSPARQQRDILAAFCATVRALATHDPLILLVEDTHWFGEESGELVSALIHHIASLRVLLLITSRSPGDGKWQSLPAVQTIPMEPLTPTTCRKLLDNILGLDDSLTPIKEQLIELAHGIPLFVEEFAQNLVATDAVVGQAGAFRALDATDDVALPATIQTILAARIDRLPQGLKRIVQMAAAIGTEMPCDLLAASLGTSKDRLLTELESLDGADLLVTGVVNQVDRVCFKHALVREVAYGGLLTKHRRTIHSAIAAAIEELYQARSGEHVEDLARHALGAGLLLQALHHFRQAAEKAIHRSAYRQANKLIKQALDILRQILPRDRMVIEHEIQLRLMQRVSLGVLGLYRDWFKALRVAEGLAEELSDPRSLLAVRIAQLHVLGVVKTAKDAVQITSEVVTLARTHGSAAEIAAACFFDSQACWWYGLHRQAVTSARAGLNHLAGLPSAAWSGAKGNRLVSLHTQLALNHTCLGEFDDAMTNAEYAGRIARDAGSDYDVSYAAYGLGWTLTHMGRIAEAMPALEQGLQAADRGEYATNASIIAGILGWAHMVDGRMDQALILTERALDAPEAMQFLPPWHLFFRAWVLHRAGRSREAREMVEAALRQGRRKHHRCLIAWAHWLLAAMTVDEDPMAAIGMLASVERKSEEFGMLPLARRCREEAERAAALCGEAKPADIGRPDAAPPHRLETGGLIISLQENSIR